MSRVTAFSIICVLIVVMASVHTTMASGPHCELAYKGRSRISHGGLTVVNSQDCDETEGWTHCCIAPFSNYDSKNPIPKNYQA